MSDLFEFAFQERDLLGAGVDHVESGRDGVVELDVRLLGRTNQTLQLFAFFGRVQLTPVSSMLIEIEREGFVSYNIETFRLLVTL